MILHKKIMPKINSTKQLFIKKIFNVTMLISLSIMSLFILCSAKYSSNFKSDKKHIDTITIIEPLVRVIKTNKKENTIDTNLTNLNKKVIDRVTKRLLNAKYKTLNSNLKNAEFEKIFELYDQLNKSGKVLENISASFLLDQIEPAIQSRYAIFLNYNCIYDQSIVRNSNIRNGLASSTFIINGGNIPVEFVLLVIDTGTKNVVYYDKIINTNYDPREESETEVLTKKILRKIYYK